MMNMTTGSRTIQAQFFKGPFIVKIFIYPILYSIFIRWHYSSNSKRKMSDQCNHDTAVPCRTAGACVPGRIYRMAFDISKANCLLSSRAIIVKPSGRWPEIDFWTGGGGGEGYLLAPRGIYSGVENQPWKHLFP